MNTHAIVVGGTRGIGLAIARRFAADGARVSVLGRSQPAAAVERVVWQEADASDRESLIIGLNSAKARQGMPGALVLAQRYRGKGDTWEGELATTLTASNMAVEWAANELPRDSAIVVVSSVASTRVASEQPAGYHAAKAALSQIVRYYATTLGPRGIRVNAVSPGTTVKDESKAYFESHPEIVDVYRKVVPLGRMGTAAEVANLVAFLAGPGASFITGQDIVIDGGASLLSQESLGRRLSGVDYK